MSINRDLKQIYDANPTTTLLDDMILYLVKSAYTPSDNSGIKSQDLIAQIRNGLAASGANFDITNLGGITGGVATSNAVQDGEYSGNYIVLTAAESLNFGDVCYIGSDNQVHKADNTNSAKFPSQLIAGEAISATSLGHFLIIGTINSSAWTWTAGGIIYLGTSGGMTQTPPSTRLQVLGIAINTNLILFMPTSFGLSPEIATNIRTVISAAKSGANSDITSLTGINNTISINGSPATLNASGTIISTYNAAETVAFGQAGYITTSGTIGKADATNAAKFPVQCLILGTATIGNPVSVLLPGGTATLSSWAWTPGAVNPIYLSIAGAMTQTAPSGTDNCIQKLATPISATTILFNPSADYITHT